MKINSLRSNFVGEIDPELPVRQPPHSKPAAKIAEPIGWKPAAIKKSLTLQSFKQSTRLEGSNSPHENIGKTVKRSTLKGPDGKTVTITRDVMTLGGPGTKVGATLNASRHALTGSDFDEKTLPKDVTKFTSIAHAEGGQGALMTIHRDITIEGKNGKRENTVLETFDKRTGEQVKLSNLLTPQQLFSIKTVIADKLGLKAASEVTNEQIDGSFCITNAYRLTTPSIVIQFDPAKNGRTAPLFVFDAPDDDGFKAKIGLK